MSIAYIMVQVNKKGEEMKNLIVNRNFKQRNSKSGMEMVQIAIIIAIAIAAGIIFKDKIGAFINDVFGGLSANDFKF